MDQSNTVSVSTNVTHLGSKSWTAYVGLALAGFVLFTIGVLMVLAEWFIAGFIVLMLAGLFLGYRVLELRSYRLYHDDIGVWVYSGILPWRKGVSGVKWRDMDEAVYFQTLWSWLFKSYSLRIGHRFTKTSEINLSHIARGHEAVLKINAQHETLIRSEVLK